MDFISIYTFFMLACICIYALYSNIFIEGNKTFSTMVATWGVEFIILTFLYCWPLYIIQWALISFYFLELPADLVDHSLSHMRRLSLWAQGLLLLLPESQSYPLFSIFLPWLGLWLSEPVCPVQFLSPATVPQATSQAPPLRL